MIRSLQLKNFRNFKEADLQFDSRSVVFCGPNGSGKTSLLESLYYLANLRSFRTGKIQEMKRLGTDEFKISAESVKNKLTSHFEVTAGYDRRIFKIDDNIFYKASDFTGRYNTIAFLPDDPEIISGSSSVRRRFLDMFISMTDREYFLSLQQYISALKIRNALLRQEHTDFDILRSYHPILAEHGSQILKKRFLYIRILTDFMQQILLEIRPELTPFEIRIRSNKELEDAAVFCSRLSDGIFKDKEKKYTGIGPHLDDFDFLCNGRSLRIYGSRGQCRMASFALKLAEFEILNSCSGHDDRNIVIVDDATGDLDERAKNQFYEKVQGAGQIFYAFTDMDQCSMIRDQQIIMVSEGKTVNS